MRGEPRRRRRLRRCERAQALPNLPSLRRQGVRAAGDRLALQDDRFSGAVRCLRDGRANAENVLPSIIWVPMRHLRAIVRAGALIVWTLLMYAALVLGLPFVFAFKNAVHRWRGLV